MAGQAIEFLAHIGPAGQQWRLPGQSAPAAGRASRAAASADCPAAAPAALPADPRPAWRRPPARAAMSANCRFSTWPADHPRPAGRRPDRPARQRTPPAHRPRRRPFHPAGRPAPAAARRAATAAPRERADGCRESAGAGPWQCSEPAPAPRVEFQPGLALPLQRQVGGDVAALQALPARSRQPGSRLSQPFGRRKRNSRERPFTLRSSHAQPIPSMVPSARANPVIEAIAVMARLLPAPPRKAKRSGNRLTPVQTSERAGRTSLPDTGGQAAQRDRSIFIDVHHRAIAKKTARHVQIFVNLIAI